MSAPTSIGAILEERQISLKLRGFDLLFAWHSILIFAPLISNWDFPFQDMLWLRQVVLCLSVVVAFVVYPLTCQSFYSYIQTGQRGYIALFMLIAIVGSAATCFALNPTREVLLFISTAFAGLSEGILMMFWLTNYYSVTSIKTNTGASQCAIIGTALCFVLCHTSHDVALIATSILPVIAAVLLVQSTNEFNRESALIEGMANRSSSTVIDAPLPESLAGIFERSKQHFEIMILLTVVFGLSFGLVQASILERIGILIGATNSFPMLGAVFAYISITCLLRFNNTKTSLIIELVFSFAAFSFGALGASFASSEVSLLVFGAIFIMGFHLFDFAVLAITIDTAENGSTSPIFRIGINRAAVYFSYGAAFFIGHTFMAYFDEINTELLAGTLLLILIVVLVLYIAFVFSVNAISLAKNDNAENDEPDDADLNNRESSDSSAIFEQPEEQLPQLSDRCKAVSEEHHLTPRENDVLEYLARGRNAAYIAQALWISPLTAKTHIANIYRKLDVHSSQELLDIIDRQS